MDRSIPRGAVPLAALLLVALAVPAAATVQTFDGYPAGTVVAGTAPDGAVLAGDLFADFVVSVENRGTGPHAAVLFDSAHPTGGDLDLGTPNRSCGGRGIGSGGRAGAPGANCAPLGALLVVAEDVVDVSPRDGRVDDPDDAPLGGVIVFDFHRPVRATSIVLVDVDGDGVVVDLVGPEGRRLVPAANLGNNSVQRLDLRGGDPVYRVEVRTEGSGAIAELEYEPSDASLRAASSWAELEDRDR